MEYFLGASGFLANPERRVQDLADMARLCLSAGDANAAKDYIEQAEKEAATVTSEPAKFPIYRARAAVAARLGETETATACFARAFDLCPAGYRGEFLLDYGRFLASIKQTEQAKRMLLEACGELAKSQGALERQARTVLQTI